jgi:hypothetical protein
MRTKRQFILVAAVSVPLATLTGCGAATHEFLVHTGTARIRHTVVSMCNTMVPVRQSLHEATGTFRASCPGPFRVQVDVDGAMIECRIGYIDAAERSKRFVFVIRDGRCSLVQELELK